jgi:hypothetical protein
VPLIIGWLELFNFAFLSFSLDILRALSNIIHTNINL